MIFKTIVFMCGWVLTGFPLPVLCDLCSGNWLWANFQTEWKVKGLLNMFSLVLSGVDCIYVAIFNQKMLSWKSGGTWAANNELLTDCSGSWYDPICEFMTVKNIVNRCVCRVVACLSFFLSFSSLFFCADNRSRRFWFIQLCLKWGTQCVEPTLDRLCIQTIRFMCQTDSFVQSQMWTEITANLTKLSPTKRVICGNAISALTLSPSQIFA